MNIKLNMLPMLALEQKKYSGVTQFGEQSSFSDLMQSYRKRRYW